MGLPAAPKRACPVQGDLLEYHFGASPRQEQLRAHLAGCPACAAALAELERQLAAEMAEQPESLPESFWDRQRRDILAQLPPPRPRRDAFRLWPAWALTAAGAVLGCVLLWQSGIESRRVAQPADRQAIEQREDRLFDELIERATTSPARNWIASLNGDPELRSIREVYEAGDVP